MAEKTTGKGNRKGWAKSSRAVRLDSRLSQPIDSAVHSAFASHMNKYSNTFVGQETIATLVGRDVRTVRRSIERLKACGYLNEVRRLPRLHGKKGGAGSWQYEVLMEPWFPDPAARPDTGQTETVASDRTRDSISDRTDEFSERTKSSDLDVSDRTKSTLRPDKTDVQTGHPCPDKETHRLTRILDERDSRTREAQTDVASQAEETLEERLNSFRLTPDLEAYCNEVAPNVLAETWIDRFKQQMLATGCDLPDYTSVFIASIVTQQQRFETRQAMDREVPWPDQADTVQPTAPVKKKDIRLPTQDRFGRWLRRERTIREIDADFLASEFEMNGEDILAIEEARFGGVRPSRPVQQRMAKWLFQFPVAARYA